MVIFLAKTEFVKTGIPDLEEKILNGHGLPRPGTLYILGHPGVGKTTIAIRYVTYRASLGENSIYLSLLEDKESLVKRFKNFNFGNDFEKYVDEGKIIFAESKPIYGFTAQTIRNLFLKVADMIKSKDIKNLVIDSVTALTLYLEQKDVRTLITQIYDITTKYDLTTIMIGELPLFSTVTLTATEEFIADIVILIDYIWVIVGAPRLAIRLVPIKSRLTDISRKPYEIGIDSEYGIRIIHEIVEPHVPFKREVVPPTG
jgi:circadian clock protein KaiC